MALHHAPFALCVAEANPSKSPSVSCNLPLPLVMKDDMHHHHHHQQQQQQHHHLHDYERLSKLPTNGKSAWSDTATECLIEVFEEKWNSLRRGNLKAKNWDELAVELGSRCGVPKTGDQCRHKIEKLRGRFRQEKVLSNFNPSKWPWYERLNMVFGDRVRLLRDAADLDKAASEARPQQPPPQQQQQQNRVDRGSHPVNVHREDRTNQLQLLHHQLQLQQHYHPQEAADEEANTNKLDTSYSSQSRESTDDGESREARRRKRARTTSSESELPAFVRSLNERMDEMQRDYDKLRSEVEARAAQMQQVELKRTEMLVQMEIRRTQLVYEVTKMQMDFLETLLGASRGMNHNSKH